MLEPDSLGRLVCIFPAKRCLEIFTQEFIEANPLAMIRAHMWFVGMFITKDCIYECRHDGDVERISQDYRAQVCGIVAILSFKDLTMWDQLRFTQILSVNEVVRLLCQYM
jgi:hypothetical protein